MLLTSFTKDEILSIIHILQRNMVPYQVSPLGSEHFSLRSKLMGHTHTFPDSPLLETALYQIEVNLVDIKRLPTNERLQLENLRIYADAGAVENEVAPIRSSSKRIRDFSMVEKILMVLMLGVGIYLTLDWIDRYVYPILGGQKYTTPSYRPTPSARPRR